MVYKSALGKGFSVPAGKYYLADAGYKNKDSQDLLTPYLKVRYYLREQARASCRPETPEELFNLRHAQLRNVVERAFGVLKKRFRILNTAPVGYTLKTQVRIVYALTALHNFYNLNGLDPNSEASFIDNRPGSNPSSHDDSLQPDHFDEDSFAMHDLRGVLTYEMFEDYRQVRASRYGDTLQAGVEPWTQPFRL
jgi:DDE superfamily endonuclease